MLGRGGHGAAVNANVTARLTPGPGQQWHHSGRAGGRSLAAVGVIMTVTAGLTVTVSRRPRCDASVTIGLGPRPARAASGRPGARAGRLQANHESWAAKDPAAGPGRAHGLASVGDGLRVRVKPLRTRRAVTAAWQC